MTPDPVLRQLVKRALQREAARNLADGQRLIDGQWVLAETIRPTRRRRFFGRLLQTVEALAFWAMTALVGLAFMAIVVAIL
jgi:hypothetical protein